MNVDNLEEIIPISDRENSNFPMQPYWSHTSESKIFNQFSVSLWQKAGNTKTVIFLDYKSIPVLNLNFHDYAFQ
jgi:hypothetical protein